MSFCPCNQLNTSFSNVLKETHFSGLVGVVSCRVVVH